LNPALDGREVAGATGDGRSGGAIDILHLHSLWLFGIGGLITPFVLIKLIDLLGSSILLTVVVAAAVGLVYPAVMWGIGQVAFRNKADGSLISRDGKPAGATRSRRRRARPEPGLGPALTVAV
jgi:hypothetical protein